MRFPVELWSDPTELRIVRELAEAFPEGPLLLTDGLLNILWLNEEASALFGDRSPALVNRTTYSLLGLEERGPKADALRAALHGEADPWKAMVHLPLAPGPCFAEASAIRREGRLLAGVLRLRVSTAGKA